MNILSLPVRLLGFLPRPLIKLVAFKYVAGETFMEVFEKAKKLNHQGFSLTMDILGESASDKAKVEFYVHEYKELIKKIAQDQIKAGISIKPTALGLLISYDYALSKFREITAELKKYNLFLRIDMEDTPYTDQTIKLYEELRKDYERIGIVFQAYLKRTQNDLVNIKTIGDVRICKGIYIESPTVAIKGKDAIRKNYLECLEYMLNNSFNVGVATHDDFLIDGAIKLLKKNHSYKGKFEFQMLYGVRTHRAYQLIKDNFKVRLYLPFGKDWYAYSMRRMYENPYIAFHVTKALFFDPIWKMFR